VEACEGGQRKEMGLQIIGTEQWLIAWRCFFFCCLNPKP
jgi:hypothetical protein